MNGYETVIGIETHVQLKTKSKLFCGCNNDAREAAPNTLLCPVCTGQPGSLPVLNEQAIRLSLQAGLALNGKISKETKFDRKNYFYPDLPKGYQITQYDQPIVGKGYVEVPLDKKTFRVGITRAHLEEDAGKLLHPEGADYSLVDLNRAGTPLLEIVSEPDIRSPEQAKAYAQELYNIMRYAHISDADLYYGNMRFDINVSVRLPGKELGIRSEIKNLNSFRSVERASEYEIKRQVELLEKGQKVAQETRGWNEAKNKTFAQRSKEEAMDYRYFPEPDLPPLVITDQMIEAAQKAMPLLPNYYREELRAAKLSLDQINTLLLTPQAASISVAVKKQADNAAVKRIANWFIDVTQKLTKSEEIVASPKVVSTEKFIKLSQMVDEGKLSSTTAKDIFWDMLITAKDPEVIAKEKNYLQLSDIDALGKIVELVIAENEQAAEDVRRGEAKAIGFLVGQVMKQSHGQANPQIVQDIIRQKLS